MTNERIISADSHVNPPKDLWTSHAPARLRSKRRIGQAVAHHFKNLLDARLDDPHERGARNELRRFSLIILDRRYRDHVALIRAPGQNTAINRFDSLSVGNAGVETAGQIHGHVLPAERKAVGVDEFTA